MHWSGWTGRKAPLDLYLQLQAVEYLIRNSGSSPLSEQRHSRDVPSFVVASLESILTVRLGSKKLAHTDAQLSCHQTIGCHVQCSVIRLLSDAGGQVGGLTSGLPTLRKTDF